MKQDYKKAAEALEKKLIEYLKNEEIVSLDFNVSEKQLEKLFFIFTKDFLKNKIFFDDYSTLCEKLLMALRNIQNRSNSDIYMVFHYGAELSWYIRNDPFKAADFLDTILDYHKKNHK